MWFKELMGFDEVSPEYVKENSHYTNGVLTSKVNHCCYQVGELSLLSLKELRDTPLNCNDSNQLRVTELVGDIQKVHADKKNENCLIQAASQFNLLEMISPSITPSLGIDCYENDYTQGPACAISCGAGTVYRNYFVRLNTELGQTGKNQIDCLEEIATELKNKELSLWEMKNGYALLTLEGLRYTSQYIETLNNQAYELLKGKLKVGVQWNTEVTISKTKHLVSQIYCAALPVAYSSIEPEQFANFATLILEATYEATLYVAMINYAKTGNNKVFLTLVGGGAFGNKNSWLKSSILKVLTKFKHSNLDITFVSYNISNPLIKNIINDFSILR